MLLLRRSGRWWRRSGPLGCRCRRWLRRGLRRRTGILPESAVVEFPVRTIGILIALATAEPAFGAVVIATIAELPAIVAIAVLAARSVAIMPVAPVTTEILALAPIIPIIVVALVAVVPRLAVIVAVLMIEIAWLLLIGLLLRTFAALLLRLDAELVAVLLAAFIAIVSIGTGERMRTGGAVIAKRINSALLRHLFAVAQDDAIVMLGVLKIIFSENRIARRQRIARQRNILFRDMRGGATDLHVRTRALEAAHQRIL